MQNGVKWIRGQVEECVEWGPEYDQTLERWALRIREVECKQQAHEKRLEGTENKFANMIEKLQSDVLGKQPERREGSETGEQHSCSNDVFEEDS